MFIVKLFNIDPSSYKINDVNVFPFNDLKKCKKFIVKKHWEIDYENMGTDLNLEEFLNIWSYEDLVKNNLFYDTFEFEIEEVGKIISYK